MLRRWWIEKYRQPWTAEVLEELNVFDLLTERYEDLFESNPDALREASRDEAGELVFDETSDNLINKWERELAMGLTPDLTEGMTAEAKANLGKEGSKLKRAKELSESFGTEKDVLAEILGSNSKQAGINIDDRNLLREHSLGNTSIRGLSSNRLKGR